MSHLAWFAVVLIAFAGGAYAGTKYPSVNVIGKVIG